VSKKKPVSWRKLLECPCHRDDFILAVALVELQFGVSADAIFEIYRREGVVNFIDHLTAHSDEELQAFFDRYTAASLAEQHYLTHWFYDLVSYISPDMWPSHRDLLYREALRWLEKRHVINESEAIKLLWLQPWLKDEIVEFLDGLEYVESMKGFYRELEKRR